MRPDPHRSQHNSSVFPVPAPAWIPGGSGSRAGRFNQNDGEASGRSADTEVQEAATSAPDGGVLDVAQRIEGQDPVTRLGDGAAFLLLFVSGVGRQLAG